MTDPYRPLIRSQADLTDAWRDLVRPLGFHRRSLWMFLIDGDDRPTPVMTEVTDLPDGPDSEATEGLADLLEHFVTEVVPAGRWALMLSRPGSHPADEADRAWAGAFYATLRERRVAHDVVHLANDVAITPIPLDEVTGHLRAS